MENVSYLCIVTDEVTKHRQLDAQTSRSMLVPYTEHLGFLLIPMSEEIWKPVLGYEGLYEVSNLGRVRSVEHVVEFVDGRKRIWPSQIKKPVMVYHVKSKHYITPTVSLYKDRNGKQRVIAHLVCEAFHGPRPEGSQCMHLDGNPQNNCENNLAWGTIHENSNEPIRRSRLKKAAEGRFAKYWKAGYFDSNLKPCLQYTLSGEFIKEHRSTLDAEKETGIKHITISRACRGMQKTSGGYIWKFKTK